MGNNQSTEQVGGETKAGLHTQQPITTSKAGPPVSALRRIDLSAQDGSSPSPFSSPAIAPAKLAVVSPASSPAPAPASSLPSTSAVSKAVSPALPIAKSRAPPPTSAVSKAVSPALPIAKSRAPPPTPSPRFYSPASSPAFPPASSPRSGSALSPAISSTSSPATSPGLGPTSRAKGNHGTVAPATHFPGRPLSIISESVSSESLYSPASPRLKSKATSTPKSPAARQGIADFNKFFVSASEMDVGTAIMLLQEIKKHASPEDLAALHKALEPEKTSGNHDTGKLASSASCPGVQGCVCELNKASGFQPTASRLSSTPRLSSLMAEEKSWAGREFLRTLSYIQDQPSPAHPECLRIANPRPEFSRSAPDSIGSWSECERRAAKSSSKPATTPTSKKSPTTPQHPKRADSLSPPPTGDSGYSSGSSGRSSSWHQYRAAAGGEIAPLCESPLKMDSAEQKSLRRYVAVKSSSDSLTGSNHEGDKADEIAVKLQSISSNQSSIVQKRLQKKRPAPIMQGTKKYDPYTPSRPKFSRRSSNPSGSSTPILPTEDCRELVSLAQAAAERIHKKAPHPAPAERVNNKTPHPFSVERVNNKTPHPTRKPARQLAELEADRPTRPVHGRRRSLSFLFHKSIDDKVDITHLVELEADRPHLAIYSRTRGRSILRRRSTASDAQQLHELEADRPASPASRPLKRRSASLFTRRSGSYRVEIPRPDSRHFSELEAPRTLTPPTQSRTPSPPRSNKTSLDRERHVSHHVSIADLGATANSLGSILYDGIVTGMIPDTNVPPKQEGELLTSKQYVPPSKQKQDASSPANQDTLHPQHRCRSLGDLKSLSTTLRTEPIPSVPFLDTSKYSLDTKTLLTPTSTSSSASPKLSLDAPRRIPTPKISLDLVDAPTVIFEPKPDTTVHDTSCFISSLAQQWVTLNAARPGLSTMPNSPMMPKSPMTPTRHAKKQSQISHLVARFELADTSGGFDVVAAMGKGGRGNRELHRNASMPIMRRR